ncbi:MAG: DUF1284 domain-containing protein [Thermacetogeniaceae bacterium]|nr:DUF1284 domain-containing protein [Syntrophomonadaceae bacterium]
MKLRGHHLICLHYYRGEGYSEDYVEHLWKIVKKAEGGETIEVIAGADDVCKACPYLKGDSCAHKEGAEQEIRELDQKAFDFLSVQPGSRVLWSDLQKKVMAAPKDWFDSFCSGCDWFDLCTRIRNQEGSSD